MKKFLFTLVLSILFSAPIVFSQCPNNISFYSQADIDNFPINYPNCTEIEYECTVSVDGIIASDQISLYPNPFTAYTTFEYNLNEKSFVQITIYNHLGEQVDLITEEQNSGTHKVVWDASRFKSGIYFYRLQVGAQTATGKLIILR